MGLRTIAIDTGERKEKLCKQLGVEKWIDFRDTQDVAGEIVSFTGGGAHVAIVTSGSPSAYASAANYLRPRGSLMVIGVMPGTSLSIPLLLIVGKGLSIRGISTG